MSHTLARELKFGATAIEAFGSSAIGGSLVRINRSKMGEVITVVATAIKSTATGSRISGGKRLRLRAGIYVDGREHTFSSALSLL